MPKDKKYVPPEEIAALEENIKTLVGLLTASVHAMGGDMMVMYVTDKETNEPGVVLMGSGEKAVASVAALLAVIKEQSLADVVRESPRPN